MTEFFTFNSCFGIARYIPGHYKKTRSQDLIKPFQNCAVNNAIKISKQNGQTYKQRFSGYTFTNKKKTFFICNIPDQTGIWKKVLFLRIGKNRSIRRKISRRKRKNYKTTNSIHIRQDWNPSQMSGGREL